MILASCSYEEAIKYKNKLVLVSEENSKKLEEVFLNIVTDNPDDVLAKGIGRAKCVTTKVKPSKCPENLHGDVFFEVSLEDFSSLDDSVVEGVVTLVRLPEGFSDMRRVLEVCSSQGGKVRVIGGNLLEIPGVNIGRYEDGKEKMSSVFCGVYDFFREVDLADIEVKEVMSKIRAVSGSGKTFVAKKPNVKTKKKEAFNKFFGSGSGGF